MKPHLIEIENLETQTSIVVDMEGPYHPKNKRTKELVNIFMGAHFI